MLSLHLHSGNVTRLRSVVATSKMISAIGHVQFNCGWLNDIKWGEHARTLRWAGVAIHWHRSRTISWHGGRKNRRWIFQNPHRCKCKSPADVNEIRHRGIQARIPPGHRNRSASTLTGPKIIFNIFQRNTRRLILLFLISSGNTYLAFLRYVSISIVYIVISRRSCFFVELVGNIGFVSIFDPRGKFTRMCREIGMQNEADRPITPTACMYHSNPHHTFVRISVEMIFPKINLRSCIKTRYFNNSHTCSSTIWVHVKNILR